jgi:alpha-L-rhamnosidase
MKINRIHLVFLVFCFCNIGLFAQKTLVEIKGNQFYINGKPTYKGRSWQGNKIEGLLVNSRMVQGIFDDLNPKTAGEFAYADTKKWDADRNTNEFIAAMPLWYENGMNAFTINMQGGSPYGYGNKKCLNPGFNPDGSLMQPYMNRLDRILKKADELHMVVILGIFYFGQDQNIKDEAGIINATDNLINWLFEKGYRNVIIEIANECNAPSYNHPIIYPERITELINRVKNNQQKGYRFLVSTSFGGCFVPTSNVVKASDFLLIHGNGAKSPKQIQLLIDSTKKVEGYRNMPIVNNEDDHFDFEKDTNNFVVSIKNYVSWGYFDFRFPKETAYTEGYQTVPVDWGIHSERKKAFFKKAKEITGGHKVVDNASTDNATLQVLRMRVEALVAPLGLHETAPRLSWEVSGTGRNIVQNAYQIKVATSQKLLKSGKADLWDSGKVASDETTQIPYAGRALVSNQAVFWQVTVWDNRGKKALSPIGNWSMGLLKQEDWGADWIGLAGQAPATGTFPLACQWISAENPSASGTVFRKTFELVDVPDSAKLMVAADHNFTLRLNERHIMSGENAPTKGQSLEIAGYLHQGKNALVVELNGNKTKHPKLLLGMEIAGNPIFSDKTWKVVSRPITHRERGNFDDTSWATARITEPEQASWIAQDRMLPARLLRKDFTTKKSVRRATLHIIGVGYHEAYLNGVKISDHVLSPGITDYTHRLPAVTHDVTSMIQAGMNTIGIHLGNGRYWAPRTNVPAPTVNSGVPVAKARLILEYQDGSTTAVVTGQDWQATDKGAIRANNDYDGEYYDARLEQTDWSKSGFNTKDWQSVEILPAPKGLLPTLPCPPIRVTATLPAIGLKEVQPNKWIFDFGQNIAGWCRLRVKGAAGTTIRLRHAETVGSDGLLHDVVLRSARATDVYVLKGDPQGEVWEPRFTSHGFRFVELTGFSGKPDLATLEACVVGSDLERVGDFTCSNATINRFVENARWSMRGNFMSIPTDCPQRDERQGWQGDRTTETRSETYLFDVAAFYTRYLDEIRVSQRADGNVSDVAPALWQFYSGSAVWPSIQTVLPETMFLNYGDRRILERQYEGSSRWVKFLLTRRDTSGLLPPDTYGDWVSPPQDMDAVSPPLPQNVTDKKFISNAFLVKHLSIMVWFAKELGKNGEAQEWQTKYDKARDTFLKHFSGEAAFKTQANFALAQAFNLVPTSLQQTFKKRFIDRIQNADNGHIGTGVIGTQWLHLALDDLGQTDTVLALATRRTYPSWGFMIENGATSVWELWNGNTAEPSMNSRNHIAMIGDAITWLFERLAGIHSDAAEPGFKHIILKPTLPKGLSEVTASHHSPHGWIRSTWKKSGESFYWEVEIPANTHATLYFPAVVAPKTSTITEDGKPFGMGERDEKGRLIAKLGSGKYRFLQVGSRK